MDFVLADFFCPKFGSGCWYFLVFLRYLWNGSSKLQMSILQLVARGICYRIVTEFTWIGVVVKKLLAVAQNHHHGCYNV